MKYTIMLLLLLIMNYSYSQEFSITHDGLSRTYRLHLPVNYNPDSIYPLVINMHGLGSNAWEQQLYTEFNNVSDTGDFIVVYPNGIDETWNISSSTGTDDVGFISALIDTLDYLYDVDLNRVYATGMSMGGFMSYRLACELSERIAAIASVTGLQAFYPCTPSRPVPVAQFHGTADPTVPYIGVATTTNNWINYNGCPLEPVVTDLPDIVPEDNSTVTLSYYGLCSDSSQVLLYTINNGEHTWPGAIINIGVTNQDIKASNEIWKFFIKYNINGSTGINNDIIESLISVRFYPNPVKDLATAELPYRPEIPFRFRILDSNGKICMEINGINEQRFPINCSRLAPGFYIAEIYSEGRPAYQKVIIQ